jgi:hypothetical protein
VKVRPLALPYRRRYLKAQLTFSFSALVGSSVVALKKWAKHSCLALLKALALVLRVKSLLRFFSRR